MSSRWLLVSICIAASASAAPRGEDGAAFQRELDGMFFKNGLTADQAAQRAAKVAPQVQAKRATRSAAAADVSRAKLTLWPVIGGKATYTRLSPVDPVVIPLGPMDFVIPFYDDSIAIGTQINVNLSDYVSRDPALIDAANMALEAAHQDLRATASSASLQAREIYYEWIRAKLQLLVARRQLVQVDSTAGQTKALVDVQRASTADLMRIQSQRANAAQTIQRLETTEAWRQEQLRLMIGAEDDEVLAVGEDVRIEVNVKLGKFVDLAVRAAAHRPDIAEIEAGIQAKDAQLRAEGGALLPKISLFGSVDLANPNPRYFPQENVFKLSWAAGIQASWIINETMVANEMRNRYAAEADGLRAERKGLERQVRLEVLRAVQGVQLASREIETTQQGVDAAEEGYRVRKDLFGANRASVVEMVDAETELFRARIAAVDARIDLRIALARLHYAIGDVKYELTL